VDLFFGCVDEVVERADPILGDVMREFAFEGIGNREETIRNEWVPMDSVGNSDASGNM